VLLLLLLVLLLLLLLLVVVVVLVVPRGCFCGTRREIGVAAIHRRVPSSGHSGECGAGLGVPAKRSGRKRNGRNVERAGVGQINIVARALDKPRRCGDVLGADSRSHSLELGHIARVVGIVAGIVAGLAGVLATTDVAGVEIMMLVVVVVVLVVV
jgi:hypothetical protein